MSTDNRIVGSLLFLNNIREGKASSADLQKLNERYDPSFQPEAGSDYIRLTTHETEQPRVTIKNSYAILPNKRFLSVHRPREHSQNITTPLIIHSL